MKNTNFSDSANAPAPVMIPNGTRSVFGDVSNKRTIQENDDGRKRGTKKTRAENSFKTVIGTQSTFFSTHYTSKSDEGISDFKNNKNGVLFQRGTQDEQPVRGGQKRKREKPSNEMRLSHKRNGTCTSDPRNAKKCKGAPEVENSDKRNNACLIPENYRLQRHVPFDWTAKNVTSDIAPHDAADADDVLMAADYVTDIFQYLYADEASSRPKPYMRGQKEINENMRKILIDWLVVVHMKFRMLPPTLHLCINLIDRYCSMIHVKRGKLQLVGITALMIAGKYEEIDIPDVDEYVQLCDKAFEKKELLNMERDMLQRLRYKITVPTAYPFLQRFLHLVKASQLTRFVSNYYMEKALHDHEFLRYRPSILSASAVILALNNPDIHLKEGVAAVHGVKCDEFPGAPATNALLEYTGFHESEIFECCAAMVKTIEENFTKKSKEEPLVEVEKKYGSRKFHYVSRDIELPNESFLPFQMKSND
eukprot:CAMPEP_0172523894 /NCGR_PEP_ID=MMETSP1066-20121228/293900_1 /TAXON_ID=671091 /ORGANISM="Coscinodiscus wailesii, Strain CCMP2513" /LENGTH=477 /DNA_ID=CAMNT_0013306991 /DNA_START=1016 /DNA_END=2449 /DNA_ORIENTATION=-